MVREVEEAKALGVTAAFITPLLPDKLVESLRSLEPEQASSARNDEGGLTHELNGLRSRPMPT